MECKHGEHKTTFVAISVQKKPVIPRKGQTEYLLYIWPRTSTKVKRNTGTCFFSIWFISLLSYHNRYLLRYENLLRQVDCRVTLAYWDWSLFSMSPWNNTSDRIWYPGPSGLGGNGSDGSSGGCVTDGPFARNVWRKTNGRCLRRRFSGEKQLIPTFSILFFFFSSPAPNPANRSFLSLARIWRTQERLMNRVRSFLSMPGMLPEYSFECRPNERALVTAGSVLTIGLSMKGCSHSKKQFV